MTYSNGYISYSDPWLWLSQPCSFRFASFFWCYYLFYNGFPSIGKFGSCCCLSLLSLFHLIAYHYSWNNLCNHLRDVPWKDIFKFSASVAASDFFEWVLVRIDEYIHHCKYQVKPQASPWFSNAGAAVIVDINHFYCLYQQNKSSESKVKSKQASKSCKIVLEAAKLAYVN